VQKYIDAATSALPDGVTLSYRQEGEFAFAEGFVNDIPVLTSATPTEAAYVIPLQWLARLVFSGQSEDDIMKATHVVDGPNSVRIDLAWSATFPMPAEADEMDD